MWIFILIFRYSIAMTIIGAEMFILLFFSMLQFCNRFLIYFAILIITCGTIVSIIDVPLSIFRAVTSGTYGLLFKILVFDAGMAIYMAMIFFAIWKGFKHSTITTSSFILKNCSKWVFLDWNILGTFWQFSFYFH